ncbi:hypothetical protein ACP70R_041427 [Stipagrostis hirtigluma subsp. patula]
MLMAHVVPIAGPSVLHVPHGPQRTAHSTHIHFHLLSQNLPIRLPCAATAPPPHADASAAASVTGDRPPPPSPATLPAPKSGEMEARPERRNPAASLTDEVLVEILSRLPVRSVCRFKCVSRSWRCLISDPEHRKKLPQTLAGFFYKSWNFERCPSSAHHFTNVSGKGAPFIYPSFSYLPVPSSDVLPLDCRNGLLLCCCFLPGPHDRDGLRSFHYAVCNPATEKWVTVQGGNRYNSAYLCFDPAVSSHFHVVEYVVGEDEYVTGVEIYSSRTGAWSHKEAEWTDDVLLYGRDSARSVFLDGFLYTVMVTYLIVAVDMEGNAWKTIPTPGSFEDLGFIHQVQGRLGFFDVERDDPFKLSVWILQDNGTNKWVRKHTVSTLRLFGRKKMQFDLGYKVIAVHPECNLVFFVYGWDNTLMAYEMDRREVRVIRNLGHECSDPYLPYVPLFSDSLADGQ